MKLYVYKVEKVDNVKNTATTIDHDYTSDFNELVKIRGYVKIDYFITDTSDLKENEVYFTGNLIKIIEKVTEFENEPIKLKFNKNF